MLKRFLLPALLMLSSAASSLAQGTTHLNVPAKQMVWMSYQVPAGTPGWDVIVDGTQTIYPDAAPYVVPKGYSLVITDADLQLSSPTSAALSYYGSSLSVVIASPTNTQGQALVVPFGYIPTYGVWTQVHLTAGTRIPSGYILKPWFAYGYGINASVAPNFNLILHGYYVAE